MQVETVLFEMGTGDSGTAASELVEELPSDFPCWSRSADETREVLVVEVEEEASDFPCWS
jgi:hypothetical protein